MCGIAGLWQFREIGNLEQWVGRMLARQVHRGPDDSGIWVQSCQGVGLGLRRLAILDLSPAGHQPMLSDDDQLAISFNGEIYNFQALRAELEASGVRFRSRSDTEVLLRGYEQWGVRVLDRLVGMFAFAIWDARQRHLFLARDRAGEKPLYYAHSPTAFVFASEIQALAGLPWVDYSINPDALALYLQFEHVPAPYSIYRGISSLPPAHAMLVSAEGIKIWRYWDPVAVAAGPPQPVREEEAMEQLSTLLRQAVRQQTVADVPVGAFLSGGIDSSLVVSFMCEAASGPVKTFTIGFDQPDFNEAANAEAVARYLGTDHTVAYLGEQGALDLLPQIPPMYGEPFADSSALPTNLVSRVARQRVTVSLTGDGGDETFGGYSRYAYLQNWYLGLRLAGAGAWALRPLLQRFPGRLYKVAPLVGRPAAEVYLGLLGVFVPDEVLALTGRQPRWPDFDRVWKEIPDRSLYARARVTDMLTYLPDILAKVDRAAMAVSLETRAPFLDHRLMEFALRLPDAYTTNKRLLRRLVYARLPRKLLDRPKRPFSIPIDRWFRGKLYEPLHEALRPQTLDSLGIQDVALVQRLLAEHKSGSRNHGRRLWSLFMLSLWASGARGNRAALAG